MLGLREQLRERYADSVPDSLLGTYISLPSDLNDADFDEAAYRETNPDVIDAIRAGTFVCGFEHWVDRGRHEGRRRRHTLTELHQKVLNAAAETEECAKRIGQLPLAPATLRGRLGAILARSVGRVLVWYTSTLQLHAIASQRLQTEQSRFLSALCAEDSRQKQKFLDLCAAVRELRTMCNVVGALPQTAGVGGLRKFDKDTIAREPTVSLESLSGLLEETIQHLRIRTDEPAGRPHTEMEAGQSPARGTVSQPDILGKQGGSIVTGPQTDVTAPTCGLAPEHSVRELPARKLLLASEQLELIGTQLNEVALSVLRLRIELRLDEERAASPDSAPSSDEGQPQGQGPISSRWSEGDPMSLSIENRLRGMNDGTRNVRDTYLPVLSQARAGSPERLILDLACGKGDFLHLLREQDLLASGVDANEGLVRDCMSRGLQSVQSDILPYLHSIPDATIGAITAFQVVEQMQASDAIKLIDEALRSLAPAGVMILETLHPGSGSVSTGPSWIELPNRHHLSADLLRSLVESRGFRPVELMDLPPSTYEMPHSSQSARVAAELNHHCSGERGYAVIAHKPA